MACPAWLGHEVGSLHPYMLQALFDLEATNQDLKPYLRDLYITSAKEIETGAARKAIVVHVRSHDLHQQVDGRRAGVHVACSSGEFGVARPLTPPCVSQRHPNAGRKGDCYRHCRSW